MWQEIKDTFRDDYIYLKHRKIRPFSLLWFLIRIGQCSICIIALYAFYCGMWIIFFLKKI